MHHENLVHLPTGGRRSSPKFRETLALSDEFQGLPENVTHFDILKLVKRVGRELGMTERMIQLLEYYLLFTRDQDWSANARPIVYQSLYKTARDFGVGERQIQKLEQTLFEIGALTWQDSGNHKRYGMRDEDSGDILFAYGVDLSPLASLYPLLLQKYEEKQIRDAAWMDTKRQISGTRARIRALITELPAEEQEKAHTHYLTIAYSIRAHMSLESLRELLGKHMEMRETLQQRLSESARAEDNHVQKTYIYTSKDASLGAHKYSTKNTPSDKSDTCSHEDISFQESVAAGLEGKPPLSEPKATVQNQEDHELQDLLFKITWKQVLNAASERFRDHIPLHTRALEWRDLVESAHTLLPVLGIHKSAWWEACQVMGKNGAAICIMIIDQKEQDPDCTVRNPGGYLREMTARAKRGELNLHRSVFGLLKRGDKPTDA